MLNIDLALLGIECEEIMQAPQQAEDRLDTAFENADHGLPDETDADTVVMKLPLGRFAKTTRSRMRSCVTSDELRELDRSLYRSVGLDPTTYGI